MEKRKSLWKPMHHSIFPLKFLITRLAKQKRTSIKHNDSYIELFVSSQTSASMSTFLHLVSPEHEKRKKKAVARNAQINRKFQSFSFFSSVVGFMLKSIEIWITFLHCVEQNKISSCVFTRSFVHKPRMLNLSQTLSHSFSFVVHNSVFHTSTDISFRSLAYIQRRVLLCSWKNFFVF